MSWTPIGIEQWKKAPPSEPSFSSDRLAQNGRRNIINQCYASATCHPIFCGHEGSWVQPWHVYISTGKASSLKQTHWSLAQQDKEETWIGKSKETATVAKGCIQRSICGRHPWIPLLPSPSNACKAVDNTDPYALGPENSRKYGEMISDSNI